MLGVEEKEFITVPKFIKESASIGTNGRIFHLKATKLQNFLLIALALPLAVPININTTIHLVSTIYTLPLFDGTFPKELSS